MEYNSIERQFRGNWGPQRRTCCATTTNTNSNTNTNTKIQIHNIIIIIACWLKRTCCATTVRAQTFHVADARKQMRFRQNINKPRKKLQISGNIVAEQDMKERQNIKEPMQKIDNRRIYNLLLTLPTFF